MRIRGQIAFECLTYIGEVPFHFGWALRRFPMTNAAPGARASETTCVKSDPGQEQPLSVNGQAALAYTENEGFHVFPVHYIKADGACSCGQPCKSPGKHPMTANGFKDATTDPDQIRAWWTEHPNANVAIETGTKVPPNENGSEGGFLFVIDIDPRNGGNESFAKLERTYGSIPATWTVETGGGGKHLYVLTQMQLRGKPLDEFPGIDFKGAGGCVVAAPSNHVSGKLYEHNGNWDMFDISKEPHRLFQVLVEKGARSEKAFSVDNPDAAEEDVESARRWAREKAPLSFPDGTAGATFLGVCTTLIRRMRLSAKQAEECILECYNPRLRAEGQEEWTGPKLRHKIEDACNASHVPLGKTLAEWRAERQANFEDVRSRNLGKTGAAANQNADDCTAPIARKTHNPKHRYPIPPGPLSSHPKVKKVEFNTLIRHLTVSEAWQGCWQYNEFTDRHVCIDPPLKLDAETRGLTTTDLSSMRSYLEHIGILVQERELQKAIPVAAKMHSFHPVREYLTSLPSGNVGVLDGLSGTLFGEQNDLVDEFIRKFLVSAARRILTPGVQADSLLILVGAEQGEGKTTFVEKLFGKEWTRRGLPAKELSDRDCAHALQGFWCVELGELVNLTKSSVEGSKDFLSKTSDEYRQYGNGEQIKRLRQNVFIGTTNDQRFLRDRANRRHWPIAIKDGFRIPLPWVHEHRDELWAAAMTLAQDETFPHWFSREEEREIEVYRRSFLELDPWHDAVEAYCQGKAWVYAEDVFFAIDPTHSRKDYKSTEQKRIATCLHKLGCKSETKEPRSLAKARTSNGKKDKRREGWKVPAYLAEPEPAEAEVPLLS